MRKLLAGALVALVLVVAAVASAAPPNKYTLSLGSVGSGSAAFTVTRSVLSNDPVAYVVNVCVDAAGNEVTGGAFQPADDYVVVWGLWSSFTGSVVASTAGVSCEAFVSTRPWQRRASSNVVTYTP